jgi:hypothetical protein
LFANKLLTIFLANEHLPLLTSFVREVFFLLAAFVCWAF